MHLLKWSAGIGSEPQTFLGAKWIRFFLKRVSESKKHIWALRILSFSPHYFFSGGNFGRTKLSSDKLIKAAFEASAESRRKIYEHLLKSHLSENQIVLDYGCGPGWLTRQVSANVKKIYACDISSGVLECARILNSATNIEYVLADEAGLDKISGESLDIVFSFATVLHLSTEIFESVLEICRKKLKPGGKLILHIQFEEKFLRTEEEWKSDKSVKGKIRYYYGLHCFKRPKEFYLTAVSKHDFDELDFVKIADLTGENFDDICLHHLLTARKSYF
ncbi:MAG TPA: class I SAM-dependent methyltransferase [Pyrinomonadaceae bacterium]